MNTVAPSRREGLPEDWEAQLERNYQQNIHLLEEPNWTKEFLRAMLFSGIKDQYQCGHMPTYREFINCICEDEDNITSAEGD